MGPQAPAMFGCGAVGHQVQETRRRGGREGLSFALPIDVVREMAPDEMQLTGGPVAKSFSVRGPLCFQRRERCAPVESRT